jgi:heat shock protein HslJ
VSTDVDGETLVDGTWIQIAFEGDALAAVAGCNTMRGGFTIDGDELVVDTLAQTMMACEPDVMRQDEWVAAFLTGRPTIGIDDDTLTLDDGTIEIEMSEGDGEERPFEESAWALTSLTVGGETLTAPEGAYVAVDDGRLLVVTGCNRASGDVETGTGSITVGPLAATLIACEGDVATWEAALLGFLTGELTVGQDGDTIVLSAGEDELTLERLP